MTSCYHLPDPHEDRNTCKQRCMHIGTHKGEVMYCSCYFLLTSDIKKFQHATSIMLILLGDYLSLRTLTRLVTVIICLWQPHNEAHHPKAGCQPAPFSHCSPHSSAGSQKHFCILSIYQDGHWRFHSLYMTQSLPVCFIFVQDALCITYK